MRDTSSRVPINDTAEELNQYLIEACTRDDLEEAVIIYRLGVQHYQQTDLVKGVSEVFMEKVYRQSPKIKRGPRKKISTMEKARIDSALGTIRAHKTGLKFHAAITGKCSRAGRKEMDLTIAKRSLHGKTDLDLEKWSLRVTDLL